MTKSKGKKPMTEKQVAANRVNSKKSSGRPRIPLITPDLDQEGLTDKLPPKPIDFEAVLHWMDLGATAEEIAGAFRVGVRTLDRRLQEHTGMGFGELKEKVCGAAKIALRKNQFNLTKTNATMGIWLGKQWLGQKEEPKTIEGFNGELKEFIDFLKHKYARGKDDVQKSVPAGPAEESNGEGHTVL